MNKYQIEIKRYEWIEAHAADAYKSTMSFNVEASNQDIVNVYAQCIASAMTGADTRAYRKYTAIVTQESSDE